MKGRTWKTELKAYLAENMNKKIYTDHFTKYGVDLIRNYENKNNSVRIDGKEFDWATISKGDWVLINPKHIEELELQKFSFPDFSILRDKSFKKLKSFGDFHIYEKLN